tara:strand:- start:74 stop:682 length:609 start_codon:yes stop_codon:yes gene_type:complete
LYRYTNIASTIDIINNKRLTLLDPVTWDDTNDVFTMLRYKKLSQYASVLALCFSYHEQTYHHWKVFAPGTDGICLTFKRSEIEQRLRADPHVRFEEVKYIPTKNASVFKNNINRLPFLKRQQYEDEAEFRALYSGPDKLLSYHVPIALSDLSRITISPWVPGPLEDGVKDVFREKLAGSGVQVHSSELVDSFAWKRALSGES